MKYHKPKIPLIYLLRFYFSRLISMFYALVRLRKLGYLFIHPSVTIKASSQIHFRGTCTILRGCYIDALSTDGLILGKNCFIGMNTTLECLGTLDNLGKGVNVGDNVSLGSHGYIGGGGGVIIGDDTILGNFVSIHPENHIYNDTSIPICQQGVIRRGIKIGRGCWIGAKATILDGTEIGNNVVVAAGAVVSGVFSDNVVIGGVPARIIKKIQ